MKKKLSYPKIILIVALLTLSITFPYMTKKIKKIRKNMCVHERGYWVDKKATHKFDEKLAFAITSFLKKENVASCVDFGCGAKGYYVQYFKNNNITCDGFDGNPYSPELSGGIVQVLDLSQPTNLTKSYDWVMSLEVAEHIPSTYETAYISNLDKHANKGIIISWAVEGQKGCGHVNCRNNDYVKDLFHNMGYHNDQELEQTLRNEAHLGWFKNTIMVFRKG
jgi:hypothetical protein